MSNPDQVLPAEEQYTTISKMDLAAIGIVWAGVTAVTAAAGYFGGGMHVLIVIVALVAGSYCTKCIVTGESGFD